MDESWQMTYADLGGLAPRSAQVVLGAAYRRCAAGEGLGGFATFLSLFIGDRAAPGPTPSLRYTADKHGAVQWPYAVERRYACTASTKRSSAAGMLGWY